MLINDEYVSVVEHHQAHPFSTPQYIHYIYIYSSKIAAIYIMRMLKIPSCA